MTQNPTFALSDITNKALISSESNSANSSVCLECLSSIRILQTMRNQIKDTVNSRNVIYDINNAVKFIKGKQNLVFYLDESSAFWL